MVRLDKRDKEVYGYVNIDLKCHYTKCHLLLGSFELLNQGDGFITSRLTVALEN